MRIAVATGGPAAAGALRMRTSRIMVKSLRNLGVLSLAALAGCASVPTGPSVMVLPGDGRTFDQFRYDDMDCRNFAGSQVGGTADQAAADSVAKSAVLGTIIGAAAGGA